MLLGLKSDGFRFGLAPLLSIGSGRCIHFLEPSFSHLLSGDLCIPHRIKFILTECVYSARHSAISRECSFGKEKKPDPAHPGPIVFAGTFFLRRPYKCDEC